MHTSLSVNISSTLVAPLSGREINTVLAISFRTVSICISHKSLIDLTETYHVFLDWKAQYSKDANSPKLIHGLT